MNLLIQLWFDGELHNPVNFFCVAPWEPKVLRQKISLANFSFPITLISRAEFVRLARRAKMAWKTPKIVEVPVGMEINMYACAARK
jgi:coenzyme PQQ precursor peptide PqqA